MKRLRIALLAAAASAAISTSAYAVDPGGYFSLGAGINQTEHDRVDLMGATSSLPGSKVSFEHGWLANLAGGYKMDSGFRLEMELGYRYASIKGVQAIPSTGKAKTWNVGINGIYDFQPMGGVITPYLGAGIGYAETKLKNVASQAAMYNNTDTHLQWQGIAGVEGPIGDRSAWFVEYRYIGMPNLDFQSDGAVQRMVDLDNNSHNILVGVRFSFAKPAPAPVAAPAAAPPPPPPPPPAPPAPPPPPPVPQKFLVFFDFDRSNIRADASKIITEAAAYAKKNGKVRISTTGHADTSGTPTYNLALSERRARAVKAELIKQGFKEAEVVVMFKGESEPLVQTGDGVKEPQNRRVEIVMD